MANPRRDGSRPGPPLPDIQRALKEQYTDVVREKALRFAEQRAVHVRKAGRPIPHNYARELIEDTYAAIYLGIRGWDPARSSLYVRLCQIIRDRTWKEIVQAKRYTHVPFNRAANDDEDSYEIEGEIAAPVHGCSPVLLVEMTERVVGALRAHVVGDDEAQAILDCWEIGFIEVDEVTGLTGMTPAAFYAARKRILRLAERLPPDLREAAQHLLRSA